MNAPDKRIQYPFAIDNEFGTLAEEGNYEAYIKQLMKQVLLTTPGERINRPEFGCGLRRMIFAPNSPVAASLAQVTVYQSLEKWLGNLIELEQVEVEAIEDKLVIKVAYFLKSRHERRYLNLELNL